MSSSSDEDESYKMYKDRPEWNDVKSVPQDDGPAPVVQIAYSEKFKDVFDYFRAVMAMNEKSERALELTGSAIELNPANYTVWHYRREVLKALKKDIAVEMKFLSQIIMEQQKNYQVWHHRRALVEWSQDFSEELDFTADIISRDQKNYHAWQHRQWVIQEFEQWDGELDFIDKLLEQDVRNNSAWNERYFVIEHTTGFTDEVVKREIEYAIKKINLATKNESAWSYLRGVLQDKGLTWSKSLCDQIHSWRGEGLRSPHLAAFLLDMFDEDLEKKKCDVNKTMDKVRSLCKELAEDTDTVRRKYWNFVLQRMTKEYEVK
uniref:Protein farnesyltransferase/geranylgeranyltransferase type-1 subunit alpha n=1 Tax=Phallusia mammillata TaxID=59560 RepID=A0A6F9DDK4_9ASCI|nr:fta protein [Phallusia mammillata]